MCTVAVQVFVACLRALCSADGAPSEDTCNTLRQVSDNCGELTYTHTKISVVLFMANCSSDTKPTMLTTATPPTTTTPSGYRCFRGDPREHGMEYIGRQSCNLIYVGETARSLSVAVRFSEHVADIRHNHSKPLAPTL